MLLPYFLQLISQLCQFLGMGIIVTDHKLHQCDQFLHGCSFCTMPMIMSPIRQIMAMEVSSMGMGVSVALYTGNLVHMPVGNGHLYLKV